MIDNERFPVGGEILVGTDWPETAHESADELRGSSRLGYLQHLVYVTVKKLQPCSLNEVFQSLRLTDEINSCQSTNPRLAELERAELLHRKGTHKDHYTGRQAQSWYSGKGENVDG